MADGYYAGNIRSYKRTIHTRIGAALRAMYDSELSQPMPHRLFTLLIDLNKQPEVKEAKSDSPLGSDGAG
jgi:anti-sigma factor NepR-like protein